VGRSGRLERGLLPDTQRHHRGGHERAGAPVPRAAAVQHQRAVLGVRQILLRPADACRGERAKLPHGAAVQGAGPEAGGHVAGDAGQGHRRGAEERNQEVVLHGQHQSGRAAP